MKKLVSIFILLLLLTNFVKAEVLPNIRLECKGTLYCKKDRCVDAKIHIEDYEYYIEIYNIDNTINTISVFNVPVNIKNEKLDIYDGFVTFLNPIDTIGKLYGQIDRKDGSVYIAEPEKNVNGTTTN